MKYKVIVVDDKPLIRQSVIETIDWEKLSCVVVGEAENGIEAKALIEKHRPELIISDIRMPGLDGLELTAYAKALLPESKVIIMTGYQEFEYAQRALSLGVSDLVLKPIDNRKLEAIIKKALESLEIQQSKDLEIQKSQKVRYGKYLSEIIQGRRMSEEAVSIGKYYTFVYIRVRCAEKKTAYPVKSRILSDMEKYQKMYAFEVLELASENNLVLVILEKKDKSARERRIYLKNCLQEISKRIMEEYGVAQYCVVSRTVKDISDVFRCCQEAGEIIENRYFVNEESILFVDSNTFQSTSYNRVILQELDKFYRNLEQMDDAVMKDEAAKIIKSISEETEGNEFRVKCLLSEICITLLRYYRRDVPSEKITMDTNHILAQINMLTDIQSAKAYLITFICDMKHYAGRKEKDSNPLVAGAMDYIERHYNKNISLTQVADVLNINASYLSRLLKKEEGRNFVDILTEYRIREAKRLLECPGSRVIEVCNQVGYSDYTYFYQVFKKVEGISPSEYKKNCKKIVG